MAAPAAPHIVSSVAMIVPVVRSETVVEAHSESDKTKVPEVESFETQELQCTPAPAVEETKTEPKQSTWTIRDLVWMVWWLILGALQGFVTVKCLLPYPKVLADQFIFSNFVVLKMFIGSVGSSLTIQAILSLVAPEQFSASRARSKQSFGLFRVVFGTALLGIGMAICGSGPTMIAPGLGARVKTAWALMVGGLVCVVVVGLVDKIFAKSHTHYSITAKPKKGHSQELIPPVLANTVFGLSYHTLALSLGVLMLVVGIVLEIVIPFDKDVEKYGGPLAEEYPANVLEWPAWPPLVSGISTGFSQVPIRMFGKMGLGGTTSITTIVSTVTFNRLWSGRTILHNCVQLIHNYVWVLSASLLASFSGGTSDLSMTFQPVTDGFSEWRSAVGMFVCVLGSLIAGGCTCGHGVTGISELNVEAWIGGGTIFAFAIATRCIMVFGFDIQL